MLNVGLRRQALIIISLDICILALVETLNPFHHHPHKTANGRRVVKYVGDSFGVTEMSARHPQKCVNGFLLTEFPVTGVDDFTFSKRPFPALYQE